jgi:hypothetical protein
LQESKIWVKTGKLVVEKVHLRTALFGWQMVKRSWQLYGLVLGMAAGGTSLHAVTLAQNVQTQRSVLCVS